MEILIIILIIIQYRVLLIYLLGHFQGSDVYRLFVRTDVIPQTVSSTAVSMYKVNETQALYWRLTNKRCSSQCTVATQNYLNHLSAVKIAYINTMNKILNHRINYDKSCLTTAVLYLTV
jgi:hypothetical protein